VIVSAGPVKSPQLLELSGLGDGARLQALGIPVRKHLPGVGENLIDHLQSRITFACTQSITLNEVMQSPWRQLLMGMHYLATRRGIMATSPGFNVGFFQLRPQSRGYVHARTRNPLDAPTIEPRYLSCDTDRQVMLEAFRLTRTIVQQPGMAAFVARETRPGIDVQGDDEVLQYIRKSGQTSWHPIGTCRMGADAMAVVDPELKVHGVPGLRVADSSVMPTMCSSNTNAASIMIGEKAADLVLDT
jgi:choline dehydrogenase